MTNMLTAGDVSHSVSVTDRQTDRQTVILRHCPRSVVRSIHHYTGTHRADRASQVDRRRTSRCCCSPGLLLTHITQSITSLSTADRHLHCTT